MNRRPASTYRVQVSADFPLADAAELADYLRTLGADWFYLSPLLAATPGSTHGYDVVDHSRVDPERGGADGLERLSRAAGFSWRAAAERLVSLLPKEDA